MTASETTPVSGESVSDEQHTGTWTTDAAAHDFTGGGPAGRFSVRHTENINVEVFTNGRVWLAAESEEAASASSGVGLEPDQARALAGLLLQAADEIDETTDD